MLLDMLGLGLLVLSVAQPSLGVAEKREENGKVVMCYFGSWSVYRNGEGQFDVEDIDPFVCTHLMFGFAGLNPNTTKIQSLDPWNDLYDNWGKGAFDRFTWLKQYNPGLKTILAIGGWNEGSINYSDMALTKESRSLFINSSVEMLLKHDFDGLDMDWEYPAGRPDSEGRPEDKENFSSLLRELRAAFDEHDLLLTAAVYQEASEDKYDVAALVETLDFINVMTYDYHGWWDEHHFTGHNSPLYGLPEEEADADHPGHNLNANYSMNLWVEKGAAKSQLLMGLAAYGRGFTLVDQSASGLYAPAMSGSPAGPFTQTEGYMGFNEICDKVINSGDWRIVRDENLVAPYAVRGNVWIGYDDEQSIRTKSQYILDQDFGGAMFWSIDTDDFKGKCGQEFTLFMAAAEELNGGPMTPPPFWTTPDPNYSPSTPEPATPPPTEMCDSPGAKPNPDNCHEYYICTAAGGGWLIAEETCGDLAFNPETGACDWPANVDSCGDNTTNDPEGSTVTKDPGSCNPGDPMIADPEDCSGFLACEPNEDGGYEYTENHCEDGLVFNPESQVCDWPDNVTGCNAV